MAYIKTIDDNGLRAIFSRVKDYVNSRLEDRKITVPIAGIVWGTGSSTSRLRLAGMLGMELLENSDIQKGALYLMSGGNKSSWGLVSKNESGQLYSLGSSNSTDGFAGYEFVYAGKRFLYHPCVGIHPAGEIPLMDESVSSGSNMYKGPEENGEIVDSYLDVGEEYAALILGADRIIIPFNYGGTYWGRFELLPMQRYGMDGGWTIVFQPTAGSFENPAGRLLFSLSYDGSGGLSLTRVADLQTVEMTEE